MSFEEDKIPYSELASGGPPLDEDDSDGWDELEVNGEQTTCLFCSLQFHTIAVALVHCRSEHNFDLLSLKNKFNMDCYSYIKLINYIRIQKPDPKLLTESETALWEDDIYLKPGEMETWLMYDFDDLGSAPSTPHYAIDGKTPISNINFSDLQRQIEDLTLQVKHKDLMLESYCKDIEKMKEVTRTIVEAGDAENKKYSHNVLSSGCQSGDYFNTYSHFGIHYDMLNDKVRTHSYRDAILKNSDQFKQKQVLDLGCGTGILSMFSSQAGAKTVYGVDMSEIVYKAMDIVKENNLDGNIVLLKAEIEKLQLPVTKVDIIVSEWMGYFLLFEGMLDSLINARDTYLKPDGLMLPNRCNISIVGVSDLDRYKSVINFWDDVYGLKMKCMKHEVLKEPFVECIPEEKLFTNPQIITEIDLKTCDMNACVFSSKFALTATRDGVLTAIGGYFDIFFDLEHKVEFSTGPTATKTHWQQTVFFLPDCIQMKSGDTVEGIISCTRFTRNLRGLLINITIDKNKYQYIFD